MCVSARSAALNCKERSRVNHGTFVFIGDQFRFVVGGHGGARDCGLFVAAGGERHLQGETEEKDFPSHEESTEAVSLFVHSVEDWVVWVCAKEARLCEVTKRQDVRNSTFEE